MIFSYFPRKDADKVVWATNYKTKIVTYGATLGLTPEQIVQEVKYCENVIASVNAVNDQKTVLKSIVKTKNGTMNKDGGALRVEIGRHKSAVGYTEAIGQDLGIVSSYVPFDKATYKTTLSAELFAGYVRIKFKKAGADGINLYHRKFGTGDWLFLSRATVSPYDDNIVLENPNQPEHWEYRAFGVMSDSEIGLSSGIVEIVFGG